MTEEEMIGFLGRRVELNTVTVTANDYSYEGVVVSVFAKRKGVWRCVVEDGNGRLFIHNAGQLSNR